MTLCKLCAHYEPDEIHVCDILDKIKTVADTYGLELTIKVHKCEAYKKKDD